MENSITNKIVGIFGGTFDPIHNGHLLCAQVVFNKLKLDEVWFMPAYISNFKRNATQASFEDRFNMCKLALSDFGNKKFKLSSIEQELGGVSYTVDTIEHIKRTYQPKEIFFIAGSDTIFDLKDWHQPQKLLQLATIVTVTRKGHPSPSPNQAKFLDRHINSIKIIEADVPEISSTQIRQSIQNNQYPAINLSPKVLNFIKNNNIYNK